MYLQIFRNNLREKLQENNLTLNSLSNLSDLSEDTLRSIIYGKSQDIKLSTLVKIADVLHCSLDELINRSIYSPIEQQIMRQIHKLPERSIRVIQFVVKLEEKFLLIKSSKGIDMIPVFIPTGNMRDGMYYDGNLIESLDISDYPQTLRNSIDFGIRVKTHNYEPIYFPNDILLFSCEHPPQYQDIVFYINSEGKIYIRKYTESGLEPITHFGRVINISEIDNYTALGVMIKSVNEFDIEQFR